MEKDNVIINQILLVSKKIRPLFKAVSQLRAIQIDLFEQPELQIELKAATEKIEFQILSYKDYVGRLYRKLSGYVSSYILIEYVSLADVEDRFIPVNNSYTIYLDLQTGKFVPVNEIPKELTEEVVVPK